MALLDYVAASLGAGWTISAEQMAKVQAAIPEPHKGPRQTGWLHAFLRPWRASYRVNLAPKHREAEYKE